MSPASSSPGDQQPNSPRSKKPAAWLTHKFATRTYLGKPWSSSPSSTPEPQRPFRFSHLRSRVALCEPAKRPGATAKEDGDESRPKPATFAEVVRRSKEEQEVGIHRAQMKFIPARLVASREPAKEPQADPQDELLNPTPAPAHEPIEQAKEEKRESGSENLVIGSLSWTSVHTATSELSNEFLQELDDELEDVLLQRNPTPVHPILKRIQSHLRATIPRNASGDLSQDAIYGACVPYVVFCSILLMGVFGPRSAFLGAFLSEGFEEMYGWRSKFTGLGMLVCGAVLSTLVVLRGLVCMGAKVFQDILDMELVDAKDVWERREMTHQELLVGGYLNEAA